MGSRSKEACVVCVDVGEHMKTNKHSVAQAVSSLAVQHVMHIHDWYLSVVVFGSATNTIPGASDSSRRGKSEEFSNIKVLQDLSLAVCLFLVGLFILQFYLQGFFKYDNFTKPSQNSRYERNKLIGLGFY
eukprot:TRINITY_DN51541_c0_g1_i9.p3 TRINITY_DN51541_c0_g1~~TRINITY_DN51541_c0_g1_i9.p3  ORF type:complete len:130 (-),score=5.77 TRINITY_DN51541_c0_g1_i9:132-521(-)